MSFESLVAGVRSDRWALDALASYAVLALGVALVPVQFFVSSVFVSGIPLVMIAASGLYLSTERYRYEGAATTRWRLSRRAAHLVRMTTVVGLAGMVFTAALTGGRSRPFMGLTALVGSLIFVQICCHRDRALAPTAVLAQLLAFALLVRGVALVTTPGLIGVDAWVHVTDYARSIREAGDLAAIADVKYAGAPLYHLLVVVAADVFGSGLRTALYASLGLVLPLSILLVYATSRYLLPVRWALFAAAAYGVADHVVRWGLHLIPTSMGLVFFLGVCYGLVKLAANPGSLVLYGLTLLFAFATVLTHQVSIFITLVVLATGTVVQLAGRAFDGRTRDPLAGATGAASAGSVNFAALFAITLPLTVLNWLATPSSSSSFLAKMLALARDSDVGLLNIKGASAATTDAVASVTVSIPLVYRVLDALGFLLFLLVAIVGAFTVFRRREFEATSLLWVLVTGVMLFVTLGLPMLGLYSLLPNRWFAFMYLPMAVLGAYGFRHLEYGLPARRVLLVMLAFALLFPGAMLVDGKATLDAPLDERYGDRYAYSEAELAATETVSSLHPDGATIAADHPHHLLFRNWQGEETAPISLAGNATSTDDYVVYRRSQTEHAAAMRYGDSSVRVRLPPAAVCRPSMDRRYTNGEVRYCTDRGHQ